MDQFCTKRDRRGGARHLPQDDEQSGRLARRRWVLV
jgi:hypothetical protein